MNMPVAEIKAKPKSRNWHRQHAPVSADQVNRQGRIAHLAYALLGGRDPAVLFLNTYNSAFGATPLELAGKSAAGYSAVQSEVQRLSLSPVGEES